MLQLTSIVLAALLSAKLGKALPAPQVVTATPSCVVFGNPRIWSELIREIAALAFTGQAATVTGFVPTGFPSQLSYYALPAGDTVPYLYGKGVVTTTNSAGAAVTTSIRYIIVENFEADESDSIDAEFLQLGPNLVIEDLKYCQSYTNGTSADITEADCYVYRYNAKNITSLAAGTGTVNPVAIMTYYQTTLLVRKATLTAAPYSALPTAELLGYTLPNADGGIVISTPATSRATAAATA